MDLEQLSLQELKLKEFDLMLDIIEQDFDIEGLLERERLSEELLRVQLEINSRT